MNNINAITDKNTRTRVADLIDFLKDSPVNFLAAQTACRRLEAAGFVRLHMNRPWKLDEGKGYFVTQNDSAVFAFVMPCSKSIISNYHIVSAHTDSPCFRVKPNCEMVSDGGMLKLNTEVYGGPILYTWFDRPLSLAGRVIMDNRHDDGDSPMDVTTHIVDFKRPLMTIPHLAIHFNRAVNDGNPLSKQKDMLPVVGRFPEFEKNKDKAHGWLRQLVADELGVDSRQILDFDLSLYDVTEPLVIGPQGDFITSGRIDDLSMAHAALTALIECVGTPSDSVRVAALFDNEETGSGTKQGAASPVLSFILRRIASACGGNDESYACAVADSFMISADNAHGVHPNYVDKQDPTNHPVLGLGPVIKINANCKYMTDAKSAAIYAGICKKANVPVQYFVNHSDVAGGSTLGNILTSQIPLNGVDMGAAIWAMHSARETASTADVPLIINSFKAFFEL